MPGLRVLFSGSRHLLSLSCRIEPPTRRGGTGEGLPRGTYLGGSERNTREHQTNEFARERSGGRVPLKREPPDRASASAGQRGSIPSGPAKKLPGSSVVLDARQFFAGW